MGSISMRNSMSNHNLYFVLPSSCTLSQLIPEISKVLVLVSTDSIVQICVGLHVQNYKYCAYCSSCIPQIFIPKLSVWQLTIFIAVLCEYDDDDVRVFE